ncbi:hypothetical protein NXF25_012075 [Crotalus adamanteus]|uniref:Uncharacterized protein n=1 Tax=Crotalus adamanteus TaxID=8729 RepID=A0AAW1BHN4_CROAD
MGALLITRESGLGSLF